MARTTKAAKTTNSVPNIDAETSKAILSIMPTCEVNLLIYFFLAFLHLAHRARVAALIRASPAAEM